MFDKLEKLKNRYDELTALFADPEVIADQERYRKLLSEYNDISPAVKLYKKYRELDRKIEDTETVVKESQDEPEMKALAEEELESLHGKKEKTLGELRMSLVPKDTKDKGNAILEIRAGTGGDEATLFAADIYRMYTLYSERMGWKIEAMNSNLTGVGGIKEIIASISGKNVYGNLKYESGVHRVQRVPKTEASGRIHTSAVTVAVLPEVEEVEVKIDENDLRIDRFCSSGPGGQSVNTTYSAVRITHKPTGLVVSCQDEKSQIKNKERALKVLRSRLYELKIEEQQKEIASDRRSKVGSGDRSEKIRTYNFPQGRVTDHRIGLTLYQLDEVLDGNLSEFSENLQRHYTEEKLKEEIEKL